MDLFISYRAEEDKLNGYITEIGNLQMPDDFQLDASLEFINSSSSLATQVKARELTLTLASIREKIGHSTAHMKAVTGQGITEIHRDLSPEQARSFSVGLSFEQVLQSKDWKFRRHLCHHYDAGWADSIANTLLHFAEANTFGPNKRVETGPHLQLIKTKTAEFNPYLGSNSCEDVYEGVPRAKVTDRYFKSKVMK